MSAACRTSLKNKERGSHYAGTVASLSGHKARVAYLYDGVISRSSKMLVARIPRTESKMNASLGSPDTMEYSICPLIPLSASEANTCRKIKSVQK